MQNAGITLSAMVLLLSLHSAHVDAALPIGQNCEGNATTGLVGYLSAAAGPTTLTSNEPEPTFEERMAMLKYGVWSIMYTTGGLIIGIVLIFCVWVSTRRAKKQPPIRDHRSLEYPLSPSDEYKAFFADGQFAQLVVIVLITGNVCSLAVMGILQKGEVATLYAGIVGYILGRRTYREREVRPPLHSTTSPGGPSSTVPSGPATPPPSSTPMTLPNLAENPPEARDEEEGPTERNEEEV